MSGRPVPQQAIAASVVLILLAVAGFVLLRSDWAADELGGWSPVDVQRIETPGGAEGVSHGPRASSTLPYASLDADDRLLLTAEVGACDTLPDRIKVVTRSEIQLRSRRPDGACTAVALRETYAISLDGSEVDTSRPLTVHLDRVGGLQATITAEPAAAS